jgi:DNA-binding MarR family transcriptional regulator
MLRRPSRDEFRNLLAFRVSLRRFQHWSERQARAAGLTHTQHQLLVAIKGHPGGKPPTVGELADYLLLRHHSAVELVDRAEMAGLVRRRADDRDARLVRVQLTDKGDRLVSELTHAHLAELHKLADVLNRLVTDDDRGPAAGKPRAPAEEPHAPAGGTPKPAREPHMPAGEPHVPAADARIL